MTDERKIVLDDKAREVMTRLHNEVDERFKLAAVDMVVNSSLTHAEACNVLAHVLLNRAWSFAAGGVMAEGRAPNPENFYRAARDAVKYATLRTTYVLKD